MMEKVPAAAQGFTYELDVDTAKITLTLPSEYEILPITDIEDHPSGVADIDAMTGIIRCIEKNGMKPNEYIRWEDRI